MRFTKLTGKTVAALLAALALTLSTGVAVAQDVRTIDFEGLSEGAIVSSVSTDGGGISGDSVTGSVSVFGNNPQRGDGANAAMIFDATCDPTHTGNDDDLCYVAQGLENILIVSEEDLDGTDPNDEGSAITGIYLEFDFSNFGVGSNNTVFVESIDALDFDGNVSPNIELFGADGNPVAGSPVSITNLGDNSFQTVTTNQSGVQRMRVNLNGSGAIDNIKIEPEGDPTAVTLSSLAAWSSAGGSACPLWLGLVGFTVLAAGSLFWARRRAG